MCSILLVVKPLHNGVSCDHFATSIDLINQIRNMNTPPVEGHALANTQNVAVIIMDAGKIVPRLLTYW
jgi:hypothetical protein